MKHIVMIAAIAAVFYIIVSLFVSRAESVAEVQTTYLQWHIEQLQRMKEGK
jgi:hypothetical protein